MGWPHAYGWLDAYSEVEAVGEEDRVGRGFDIAANREIRGFVVDSDVDPCRCALGPDRGNPQRGARPCLEQAEQGLQVR